MRLRAQLIFIYGALVEFVLCFEEKLDINVVVGRPNDTMIDFNGNSKFDKGKENSENLIGKRYKPEWADLDVRPLPEWYDKAKIGIFLHWGVFSVPSFQSEWFWYTWKNGKNKKCESFMEKNYPPGFTYQEFAPMFKAEFFEPNKFADLFAKAGAKYVVLTSKHHEGFTLFPSKQSFSWNSVDVGPHRDLVGDLAEAVRDAGLKFGVYHSLYEWYNPIYLADKNAQFKTQTYVFEKLWPDIKQLVNDYKPSVLWSDGDWEAYDTYWNSTDLLAWLYNDSPVKDEIVVNDRWGIGSYCHHGDFYNCADEYNPGQLQHHKWENALRLDSNSWGYNRQMSLSDVLTVQQLLKQVISVISCGGNILINVGPTKEGTIAPIFEERLLALGDWLKINGEAIYGSSPWSHQNDTLNGDVWYTCTKTQYHARRPTAKPSRSDEVTAVYATFLDWPGENTLVLGDITDLMKENWVIDMLGNEEKTLKWETSNNRITIKLPAFETVKTKYAWTLRFKPPKTT